MSTHAAIVVEGKLGLYEGIYFHFGGYPSHCLNTLMQNYKTHEKARELVALGHLSSLCNTIEKTVSCRRDRAEPWDECIMPTVSKNLQEVLKNLDYEYAYFLNTTHSNGL